MFQFAKLDQTNLTLLKFKYNTSYSNEYIKIKFRQEIKGKRELWFASEILPLELPIFYSPTDLVYCFFLSQMNEFVRRNS